jgi:hypothetical protein
MNEQNKYIRLGNKQKVVDLEKFYVNATMDNLNEIVEQKKNEIINKISDKEALEKVDIHNPYLVSMYFFKSINPLSNAEPEYSSEKLSIVWQLYMYLVEQVNLQVTRFQPTLTHFCKFAGISLSTLRNYKNSSDLQMRTLVDKIYDETFDSNMLLAQYDMLNGRSTQFRMKSENEVQEKPRTNVNININEELDLSNINKKLAKYREFSSKKSAVKEADYTEADADEE